MILYVCWVLDQPEGVYVLVPDMIFGVWISTKPLLLRVSLKSWHTPDCRRKMAWLVVVFENTHTHRQHDR